MMNYSDYDSENYSSNDDEDYVPSDDNLSEDDMNECCVEAEDQTGQQAEKNVTKKKKKSKDTGMRKRKKGGLKLEEEKEEEEDEEGRTQEQAGGDEEESDPKPTNEDSQKKKEDALWASFLSDVGPRSKPAPAVMAPPSSIPQVDSSHEPTTETHMKPKDPSKITITKVFDFAGEEVRVMKEVDSGSKEAKTFLKGSEDKTEVETPPSRLQNPSLTPGPSVKRPAGVGSVLNRIGSKKQKMSTLEKSRMDWEGFKSQEGITDELAIHNRGKEGYIERKNFLERVDQRQFQLEKSVRLRNMKQ